MTKDELIEKIEKEGLKQAVVPYTIELDGIIDTPFVIGCGCEDACWKVYATYDQGGHYVIREFDCSSDAYEYFCVHLLTVQKRRV